MTERPVDLASWKQADYGLMAHAREVAEAGEAKPWWQRALYPTIHPVETFQNALIAVGRHFEPAREAIVAAAQMVWSLNAGLNDNEHNPVTAAFGQSLRDGWAGLKYGIRTTLYLEYKTRAALLRGDWKGVKLYGSALVKGVVKGWVGGGIRVIHHLAWGTFKAMTPIGLFETVPTWWHAIKGAWDGKRGKWDVVFTSLLLMANVVGIAGAAQVLTRPATAPVEEARPGIVEEVAPVYVDAARQAWENVSPKDVPPDIAARLPADAAATRAASELVTLVKLSKGENFTPRLVEAVQTMKNAMAAGERVPSVEESVPPEVFQFIDDIARNQVFGEGNRLVIGKYESQQAGYIGAARSEGGLYYNTNPAVWNALQSAFGDQAGEVSWLINQRVLELYTYEKPPVFLNRGLSADVLGKEIKYVENIWKNPSKGPANARFWEVRWLRAQGFEMVPIFDEAGNKIGFRFVPPGGAP